MNYARFAALLAALLFACLHTPARGQSESSAPPSEWELALLAAKKVEQPGPADIRLRDQAVLRLKEGYVFVPQAEAAGLMRAMGNLTGPDFMGLVYPTDGENWFVVLSYEASGYIRDDDAKNWDVDEMLESYKAGTEEGNKERVKRGIPPMEIVGWVQQPVYDAQTHRLRWSMASRDKGAPANAEQGINYNTYALGRHGYISLNLVTDLGLVTKHKPFAEDLLASLEYDAGKRYTDFNESTDHVAEYGLAALVAGAAAKKLGFFALIAAFFAKFFKVILIAVAAVGAGLFKFFKRDKQA